MDDRTFRDAMGKFATGVTIITTSVNNQVHGMTANAFMSVSLNPKLVLISIGEKANMNRLIQESGNFGISILTKDQQDMSMYFAGQLKEKRMIDFDWMQDIPVVPDSMANITCKVHASYQAGDHTLYIGEVIDIVVKDGEPLAFFEGKYRNLVN
ncbi:flavin reductase family protein [Bacillus sp. FJAT-49736]|uniref:flavin reductase family protein n=1 Tax=Bacillus sp. FJAT-49736 TaxID=2833582 RepID=UPI001BCA1FF9|nr:flavin reductase family protein [Bacillus sp. FJAT-49736]MBS4171771.1 flavin reductase family protein [Bacillus sp. FJAT-49736]